MRRFLTYFNALLLGAILGMVLIAIVHAIPITSEVRTSCRENAGIAESMPKMHSAYPGWMCIKAWPMRLRSGR